MCSRSRRHVVGRRQRQPLLLYCLACDACARVALGHSGMHGQSFLAEYLATHESVADVGFLAVAMDSGGIHQRDAYVVQHGGFLEELAVQPQFGMAVGHL